MKFEKQLLRIINNMEVNKNLIVFYDGKTYTSRKDFLKKLKEDGYKFGINCFGISPAMSVLNEIHEVINKLKKIVKKGTINNTDD